MHKMRSRSAIRVLSTLPLMAVLAALAYTVHAQTSTPDRHVPPNPPIVEPPIWRPQPIPWPNPILNQELQLASQAARVDINGGLARTTLTQTFQNTTGRTIEGTYVFPLPEGAAVSGFAMTVNGKRVEAEILDGDKAREIYTGIVQKMKDPGILEFIDRNLIRARIFPISAGAEQKVELQYTESLRADNNSFRYVVPLRLPVGGAARTSSVDIRIQSPGGIRAVYSPTHNVEIKREGNTARISGEFTSNDPRPLVEDRAVLNDVARINRGGSDRDFVLYYTTANSRVGVNLITYRPVADEDGYFMLLAAPDPTLGQKEIEAKDVVFVFDTSGSMAGEKIEQARQALLTLLGNLNPDDRFNIVTFSSDVRTFRDNIVTASPAALSAARNWAREIKAVGGTNINDALLEALKEMKTASNHPQQIVFMTDGQPTVGETDVAQILKNVRMANNDTRLVDGTREMMEAYRKARLFVFGVGFDVNTRLLDTLAEDNRGASDYVLPQEDIEQKVGALYSKIAYPVLANPRLDWGGMKVYDVYPRTLPDMFRGTQAVVFGRYEGKGGAHPQLIGMALGREERIAGQGDFDDDRNSNDMLPRLWAMRKVGYLLDDARRNGGSMDVEVKEEIIKLSKRYGIVTPLTAGLITEDERRVPVLSNIPRLESRFGTEQSANGRGGGRVDLGGAANAPATSAGAAGPTGAFDGLGTGPSSGEKAVAAAKESKALRDADKNEETANVRYVEGKAFFLRDGVWTDGSFDAAKSPKPVVIKFASPEYFALVKDKTTAKWLSVGERVIVVLKDKTIQIEP